MKRLVLFVEGQGDEAAVPILVRRLLTEIQAWDAIFLDPRPFRVGGLTRLFPREGKSDDWVRYLGAAQRRPQMGGVLLVVDGESDPVNGRPFCARSFAVELADRAKAIGAGNSFSVAVVFACQEFESWLVAGVTSLAGKPLPPDNREGVKPDTAPPDGDLEQHPRGAKEWLGKRMPSGYDPVEHQAALTELVDMSLIGPRMRSFRRLQKAIQQLAAAFRSGNHVVTPPDPPPDPNPPPSSP